MTAAVVLRYVLRIVLPPIADVLDRVIVVVGEAILHRLDHDYDLPLDDDHDDAAEWEESAGRVAPEATAGDAHRTATADNGPAFSSHPDGLQGAVIGGSRAPSPAGGVANPPSFPARRPRTVDALGLNEQDAVWQCREFWPTAVWSALYRWNWNDARWEYNHHGYWQPAAAGSGTVNAASISSGTDDDLSVEFTEVIGHPDLILHPRVAALGPFDYLPHHSS